MGKQIAIMQDLPGPKIRIGRLKDDTLDLSRGQVVVLESDLTASKSSIPVRQENLPKYVPLGALIFLADGTIKLQVISKTRTKLECRCLNGGKLLTGKGVNIPELQKSFQGFTEQDKKYLNFGLEHLVDIVAVSFIRSAKEMDAVRNFIQSRTKHAPWIVSKIERREALVNLTSVIKASDAVMVARGDLGVENPIEQVPLIQKMIISICNSEAIPVITATQMLESMVSNPRPTRAEATDVANAVLDGSDALMLSEETAIGAYPVECVKVLDRIAKLTESWEEPRQQPYNLRGNTDLGLAQASARLSRETRSKVILCTASESLVCQIAREGPSANIVPLAKNALAANRLSIVRNVFPILSSSEIKYSSSVDNLSEIVSKIVLSKKVARVGEKAILALDSGTKSQLLLALTIKS